MCPLATSVDGGRCTFQTSLHDLELEAGAYARATAATGWVSCSRSSSAATMAPRRGSIRFGGGGRRGGRGGRAHSTTRPYVPRGRTRWPPALDRTRPAPASLPVARARARAGCAVRARRRGLRQAHLPVRSVPAPARRTRSACCSSGSSWRRACGVVVLDPNSTTSGWASRARGRSELGGAVRRRGGLGPRCGAVSRAVRVRFRELNPEQRGVRLDPLADREEYAELVEDQGRRTRTTWA